MAAARRWLESDSTRRPSLSSGRRAVNCEIISAQSGVRRICATAAAKAAQPIYCAAPPINCALLLPAAAHAHYSGRQIIALALALQRGDIAGPSPLLTRNVLSSSGGGAITIKSNQSRLRKAARCSSSRGGRLARHVRMSNGADPAPCEIGTAERPTPAGRAEVWRRGADQTHLFQSIRLAARATSALQLAPKSKWPGPVRRQWRRRETIAAEPTSSRRAE